MTTYTRKPDAIFSIVDDELIIMDQNAEVFYSSNAVGSAIWNAIAAPASLDQICAAVCAAFPDAAPQAVRRDADELLTQMEQRGLVNRKFA